MGQDLLKTLVTMTIYLDSFPDQNCSFLVQPATIIVGLDKIILLRFNARSLYCFHCLLFINLLDMGYKQSSLIREMTWPLMLVCAFASVR